MRLRRVIKGPTNTIVRAYPYLGFLCPLYSAPLAGENAELRGWNPAQDKEAQERYRAQQEALMFERRQRAEGDAALKDQFGSLKRVRDYAAKGGMGGSEGEAAADPELQTRDETGWRGLDSMSPLDLYRSPLPEYI